MRLRRPALTDANQMAGLAILVGLVTGLGAVAFQNLIELLTSAADWLGNDALAGWGRWGVVVAPVLGALVAGPLVYRYALEAKGHGVPEVIAAVATENGRIRPRVAAVKTVASAFTIGSGGSAGREGPIVQIGATLGSVIAFRFPIVHRNRHMLVAAGAAAGIAAVFNAPLAGVFFSLEVILRSWSNRGFSTVVIAAVVSSAVWRMFEGGRSALSVPAYGLEHVVELLFYLVLGAICGVLAAGFVKFLYWAEDRFDELPVLPAELRPALGALGVGLIGAWSTKVFRGGLEVINEAVLGELAMRTMLALLLAKIVATTLTLGSGGSGGIFSPSLFMGAMAGGSFGELLERWLPSATAPPGAYAVVGMAAVFGAAAQAPISAIVIVFELTNDLRIIVPLMLACVVSVFVYTSLTPDSIYMVKLRRKGISLEQDKVRQVLEGVPLRSAVEANYAEVRDNATIAATHEVASATERDPIFVITADRVLRGVVRSSALVEAVRRDRARDRPVLSLLEVDMPVGEPADSLEDGFRKLAMSDFELMGVVDGDHRLAGVVSFETITTAYNQAFNSQDYD
ncbi:MAG: chloride channel protein [Acidimicrobiia bacterium]|nr:chloride channel protein [Acidimicrobiia bacterium]